VLSKSRHGAYQSRREPATHHSAASLSGTGSKMRLSAMLKKSLPQAVQFLRRHQLRRIGATTSWAAGVPLPSALA